MNIRITQVLLIVFFSLSTMILSFSQCSLVVDENFNNYSGNFKRYTSAMANADFNGISSRAAGEIRGLDGPKTWPANNQVGNGVFRANYPKNIAGGTNCGFLFDKRLPDTEEAVMEYKIKFNGAGGNNEFVWAAGGKLPGLAGSNKENGIPVGCTKSESNIQNGFSCRLMWRSRGRLVVYTYFPDRTSNCGVDYEFASGIKPNKWYTVRQHIKLNTPGQKNGVLEMYLDGKLVLRKTNILFRNSGKGSVKINDAIMHTYRGGSPNDTRFHSPNNDHVEFDDFKVWVNCNDPGNGNNTNNPPTASWTQPILDAVPEGYTELYVLAEASDPDGDAVSTVLKIDGNEIRPEVNAPYEWGKVGTENQDETIGLTVGPHLFEVIVTDSKGASTTISKTITVVEMRGPYLGSPISIPGTIEAEHYDKGGEGEAYHDNDPENKGAAEADFRTNEGVDIGSGNGSEVIGWTSNGEWTEYTVDVTESTSYDFTIHYSANGTNAQFGIDLDGVELLSSTNLPTTGGWDSYQTSSQKSISLDAGQHIIRFKIISNGFNLDKVEVTKSIITGSSELDFGATMDIYPNPSSNGLFNMKVAQSWVTFTINGLEVARGEGSLINLSQQPKGMYLIFVDGKMSKVMIE